MRRKRKATTIHGDTVIKPHTKAAGPTGVSDRKRGRCSERASPEVAVSAVAVSGIGDRSSVDGERSGRGRMPRRRAPPVSLLNLACLPTRRDVPSPPVHRQRQQRRRRRQGRPGGLCGPHRIISIVLFMCVMGTRTGGWSGVESIHDID